MSEIPSAPKNAAVKVRNCLAYEGLSRPCFPQ
jgi:hypothetical protein